VLGFAVYVFQQWQDYKHEQQSALEREERIDVEIAGRLSQFGQWFKKHLIDKHDPASYSFKDGIGMEEILHAISEFSASPRHSIADTGAQIREVFQTEEVFPEFAQRNLLSLYAELSAINEKMSKESFLSKLFAYDGVTGGDSAAGNSSDSTTPYSKRQAEYRDAMVALLSPRYLFDWKDDLNHDTFVSLFEVTFLTPDIRSFKLPSTDCLEKTADCQPSPATVTPEAGRGLIAFGSGRS
jgi:hypothetical protein